MPNETDFMDLDDKVARRKAVKAAPARDGAAPWHRRLFRGRKA
ncbi:MAG: hypothetical protein ACXWZF_05815 [Actinomycetota bacterium]